MKTETPQILWNSEGDKGINAALYSVSMLESGFASDGFHKYGSVLATAGNTNVINLWRVFFQNDGGPSRPPTFHKQKISTKIEYLTSLTRHERSVNTVAFSPDGLHLATAGDGGSLIIWSVPTSKRGNGNGRHFWSTLTGEADLLVRIVPFHCQGICDLSWSADSKRLVVGTIDHCMLICEDQNYDVNRANPDTHQVDSSWEVVYRNSHDHSQYVQGVSYDPLGVYVASMGSDRSVRVLSRKTPPKSKKKVLRPPDSRTGPLPPPDHQRMVDQLLTTTKLEFGKAKLLKYKRTTIDKEGTQVKQHLYADESTLGSFFRRLSWTTDGGFLVTPASLWHTDTSNSLPPSFATYLFARHRFDEPYKVLPGLEKPSVAVRPNPVLFKLPPGAVDASKENKSPTLDNANLPYRSVFAVLTLDSVLVYDTYHNSPISVVQGLHYAGLTDCAWSADGQNLIVCSSDGYISIVSFEKGELGEVYEKPTAHSKETPAVASKPLVPKKVVESIIPPCEPGQTATLEARPAKRAKKSRVTPILVSTLDSTVNPAKRRSEAANDTEVVGEGVTKLTLGNEPSTKKKRIQPILLSTN